MLTGIIGMHTLTIKWRYIIKILTIGAHFDDLELSCGGTIAKFAHEGHTIWSIIITKSNYTSYNGKVMRTEQQAKKEGTDGLLSLGVEKIICLNYSTKEVPFNHQIIESLNRWMDIFKPDIIITHALNESHSDHYNTAKSVMSAARYQKTIWMFETLYPSKTSTQLFRPLVYVDITPFLNIKLKSLQEHKSQLDKYPYWKDLVTSLARLRGIETGTTYAEAFDVIKMEYK